MEKNAEKAAKWDKDYPLIHAIFRIDKGYTGDLDSPVPMPTNFMSLYSVNPKTVSTTTSPKPPPDHILTPEEVDPKRDYEFDPTKPWNKTPFYNPNRKLTFVPITVSGNGLETRS